MADQEVRLAPASPPCRGNPVISLCVLRGFRPPGELGSIDPHAVPNDHELPRDSDLGLCN
jgi:hypothetical protein